VVVEVNATGLQVPEPERYLTRAELAELMGVSVRTVDRLVADGMPSVTWGLRTRRFRASVALAWARARTPVEDAA
jgi:excisionase family DNA binding protein